MLLLPTVEIGQIMHAIFRDGEFILSFNHMQFLTFHRLQFYDGL